MNKIISILFALLIISCKNAGKENNLVNPKSEVAVVSQPIEGDTLLVENYDLIFLHPSEKEFSRLLEIHGQDSGLYEVDSDFGFYTSKVSDSLSSTDLKIEFTTDQILKMEGENGTVFINRADMENGSYGVIFNHPKCKPRVEFGVMTDLEIYQRISDQKQNCR